MIDNKFFKLLDPTNLKSSKELCMQGQCLQPQAVRETKYAQQIAILHNTIDSFTADELSKLITRLEPFMSKPTPACSNDCEKECLPPAINQISEATQKIIDMKNFVNVVLERLEL